MVFRFLLKMGIVHCRVCDKVIDDEGSLDYIETIDRKTFAYTKDLIDCTSIYVFMLTLL